MRPAFLLFILSITAVAAFAQPELEPWGNLTGIRIDGQLMPFETSLYYTDVNGRTQATAKEHQNPRYFRQGNAQVVYTHLDSLYFVEKVEPAGKGEARITITCIAHGDTRGQRAFFRVMHTKQHGVKITSAQHPALRDAVEGGSSRTDVPITTGDLQNGDSAELTLTLTTGGTVDHQPVRLLLDASHPGRPFDGLGGNFRIQNTKTDPQVIAYCLDHLRVTWGRVELPWRFWQPEKDSDPLDSALAGKLDPAVQRAVYMAGTLSERKIPVIVSAWFPPQWAVEGPLHMRPGPDHIWGNALNHANTAAIYKSIADYLIFLKKQLQVDVRYFSFNESDLGINVRQTALEHDALIKGLGAYFASRGLATRVLLGDNSDATTWSFIEPALNDPAARPYISMISFHSWRGFDTATLKKWADAASQLHVPVIVGEGSIDAAAWNYPAIFREPSYALKEISLYLRLMAVCQPLSILQWQLTSDYSLLAGGGIFGDTSALHPTQRFWNLKQLSMPPPGLFAMPISASRPDIAVAALGDTKKQTYAIHIVNNGATREVILQGLPKGVELLRRYTTSQTKGAEEETSVHVSGGQARFTIESQSFVTLLNP